MAPPLPPALRLLLWLAAPAHERQWLIADLEEEAAARAAAHGASEAGAWSRRQVARSILPLLGRRLERASHPFWSAPTMFMRHLRPNLATAFRRLAGSPAFTLVCVLTLTLGIGGNTAVFTLIDRVVLEPLPVPRPTELYRLGDTDDCCVNSGLGGSYSLFSYDLYLTLRQAAPEFSELAAFQANTRAITMGRADAGSAGETLDGAFVSGNYFSMLAITPAAGRLTQPADDRLSAPTTAVLSHRAWTQRFEGRSDVVGSPVLLNGVPATIVGIAPEGFYGETLRPNPPDIWVPLSNEPLLQPAAQLLHARPSRWLYVIGRLAPGTPIAPIEAKLTAAVQQWIIATLDLSPDDRARIPQQHVKVVAAPSGVSSMREVVKPSLQLLQAVAGVVLLIACANLANLLLARGMARRTETAVRTALGASRGRLVAEALVESLLLSLAGALAGLVVARAGAQAIIDLTFRGATAVPIDPTPSGPVVLFALGAALATAVVFGAVPAFISSRADPMDAMRGAGRTTGDRAARLRQSLIALQVALSLVLITCAGLLVRSLGNLQRQDFGFTAENLYTASLAPSLSMTPIDELGSVYDRTRERVASVPGVSHVAFALYSPLSGDNWASNITVDGHDAGERLTASWNRVTPGYFETVGTPLLKGRRFDERDRPDAPLVAIVSEQFASRFFGDADPIGRRIGFANSAGAGERRFEIVGVVGDAKYQDARAPAYVTFFLPFLQQTGPRTSGGAGSVDRSHYAQALLVRTRGSVPGLEEEIRRGLSEIDSRLIVRLFMPMAEQVAGNFNLDRLVARLTLTFGGVALLLACLGIYGVTAHAVARRTREIGIRMAVGASRPRVLLTILRGAVWQLAVGVLVGLPAAFFAARLLETTLYGVSSRDPLVLGGGLALLTLAVLAAALIPARRAARMDPVRALRME
jgi:macrolide transport system ATP-binding/permease protein